MGGNIAGATVRQHPQMALPPHQFPQDICESLAVIHLVWFQEHFGPRGIWGFEVSSWYYIGLLLTSAQITLPPWFDFGDIDLNMQNSLLSACSVLSISLACPSPRALVLLSVEGDQVAGVVPQPLALPKGKTHLATSWQ